MRLNEFTTVGGPKGPKDYGQPNSSRYIGGAKFVVGTTHNYVLTATVDKWGLEWDEDDEIWFLDSPGAAHIADASEGEIELPPPREQRYQIHDLVTDYLNEHNSSDLQKVAAHFGHTPDGDMATEGFREANPKIPGTENHAKSKWNPTNVPPKVKKLDKPLTDKELSRLTTQGVKEDSLSEFARSPRRQGGGSGGEDYFKSLAQAWYYNGVHSGDLHGGIKTQEDVERLLQRGIVAPDGKLRKYGIDYNSDFNGVVISSDDYYEHSDHGKQPGTMIDVRTRKPWGPYDYMEFTDEELDESVNQGVKEDNLNEFDPGSNNGGGEEDDRSRRLRKLLEIAIKAAEEQNAGSLDMIHAMNTIASDDFFRVAVEGILPDITDKEFMYVIQSAYKTVKQGLEEAMTPPGEFLSKAERLKAGDKVFYKGKIVGIATGEMNDNKVIFKPNQNYGSNTTASLPIDEISLREGRHDPLDPYQRDQANSTSGMDRPEDHRDDERHDLDPVLIYALKINGKIWKQYGETVTFFTKERALSARNSILSKNPELEITLLQREKD